MFVLNLALSTCALTREIIGEDYEKNMKKCNSMAIFWKMAKQPYSMKLAVTEGFGAHVHEAATVVANASSSGADTATESTEARIDGALPIVTDVYQVVDDFDLSQELRDHMMKSKDEECNSPLDESGKCDDYDDPHLPARKIRQMSLKRLAHNLSSKTTRLAYDPSSRG